MNDQNESFYIRLATPDDALTCAKIHIKSWNFAYSKIVPKNIIDSHNEKRAGMWSALLNNNECNQYVIVFENQIIGFVGIDRPGDDRKDTDFCEIGGLYLDPDYIGKGFSQKAIDWAKKEIIKRGFSGVSLWVLKENRRAITFYEKNGFRSDGILLPSGIGNTLKMHYICSLL